MADLSIDNQSAVIRKKLRKGMERIADVVNIFKEVHMVFLDIQDDTDLREEVMVAVCIFTGFCDKDLGAADTDIAVDGL